MVCAEAAEPLPTPIWMDRDGNECHETKAFGCQVTHRLCHPEFCFIGDKVGGIISMKCDGNVGGQKLCTANRVQFHIRRHPIQTRDSR